MPSVTSTASASSILILDDDMVALEEISEILELEDLSVVTASCVDTAMRSLEGNPDIRLIVTDMHLVSLDGSQQNGIDFSEQALSRFADRGLRFIVLSGDAGAIGSSMSRGAFDFLTKPLLPDALLEAVARATCDDESAQDLSVVLMRKVEETTKSLQQVTTDLAARELELSESREDYERKRIQGSKLRQALKTGHIVPWFQPQVCTYSRRLLGLEVLVRWIDPVHGMQNPGEFLPLAEEVGMMAELDAAVQRQALEAFAHMRDAGMPPCDLGINVTALQLADPGFADKFGFEIERVGLRNGDVSIEILEAVMLDVEDAKPIKETVSRLGALGLGIELDDFGTGHAGLSSLRDLPVTRIKIDQSFVRNVHLDTKLQKFTRALIALGRSLEISVLAEGVETAEELGWLANEGCTAIQGYLIARPMPAEDVLAWATRRNSAATPAPASCTNLHTWRHLSTGSGI